MAVGVVVLVGVGAQLLRPLAPAIGPTLDVATWFDADHLALVEAYRRPVYAAGLVALLVRLAVPLLAALTRPGRGLVTRVAGRAGERHPVLAAAGVVTGLLVVTDLLLLPLAFWIGFVHEGAFGFRTQGVAGWAYDWLVANAPGWVAAAALGLTGFALARRLPQAWPPVAALAGGVLSAVAIFAAPVVLEPLVFRTTPLPPGPVREAVEDVLAAAGEDVDRLLVADASRRTTKTNAYVSGLGATRRVVLYDTLVERPPGEVATILAHELGHHRNGDLARAVAAGAVGAAVVVYALALLLRGRPVGGRGTATPRTAAAVLAVVVLLDVAGMPVRHATSRRAEAAADHVALEITGDPEAFSDTMEQLARTNLSDPAPPEWVYRLWFTHPSMAERLTMGERWPDLPPG